MSKLLPTILAGLLICAAVSPALAGSPTQANFQAVQLGMTYPQVVAVLGPPSYTIYENVGGALPSAAYAWVIPALLPWEKGHIQVAFEFGKVTQKRQQGLR